MSEKAPLNRMNHCNLSPFISDIDQALALFNELREQDPYRIDNMDTFSNLLYVKVSSPFVTGHLRLEM